MRHKWTLTVPGGSATVIGDSKTTLTKDLVIWGGGLVWRQETGYIFYRFDISQAVTIQGLGYNEIMSVTDACGEIFITLSVLCEASWTDVFEGSFTKNDCTINEDKCFLSVKPKPTATSDIYVLYFNEAAVNKNVYACGDDVITRATESETYQINETVICGTHVVGSGGIPPDIDTYCPVPSGWCVEQENITQTGVNDWDLFRSYHREVATGTAVLPPDIGDPGDWTLLSGTTWWRCPDNTLLALGKFTNGRYFSDLLEYLVLQYFGFDVRSHFFGINATHAAPPANDAYTFAADNLAALVVHQKSDIKRAFASDSLSASWNMNLRDLLNDLRTMFNVYWKIDEVNNNLIIEHITYFQDTVGLDHTGQPTKNEFEYGKDIPKTETFSFMDKDCSDYFKGYPITYNCGEGEEKRDVSLFSTDVQFIKNVANAELIQDAGFVLIATKDAPPGGLYGNERVIIDYNNPLSWTELHDKLHRDYRKFSAGTLNDADVTFDSVEPLRKQTPYTRGFCCSDLLSFDPVNLITTDLGDGKIQEVTVNLYRDNITPTLAHN